jgi:hypothetical protein
MASKPRQGSASGEQDPGGVGPSSSIYLNPSILIL